MGNVHGARGQASRSPNESLSQIVIVGGCGHVGLPLGLAFAKAGKRVTAVDIDPAKVESTNAGVMPFVDRGADVLLREVLATGAFRCTTELAPIREADVVITIMGTPVDAHLNPRFDLMQTFLHETREHLSRNQLLILRSTLFPGTTDRVKMLVDEMNIDVDVAFCPERVAEGVALEEITSLPQIVAGCTPRAQERAEMLFRSIAPQIVPLAPMAAELSKLFSNALRYIQFAVSNQFYMIATDYGLDFYEIHRSMTEGYPRGKGFPTAGFAAGPCLFKDTMQLSAFHNNNFFLGHAAMLMNEGLPNYLVQRAAAHHPLAKLTCGILGMTFKADSDDTRDSLSFKLRKVLQTTAKEVLCCEPNLKGDWLTPLDETIRRSDVLFIGVPHKQFREISFGGKPVYDVWNMTKERVRVP
jgi:UDP-N-acetyl-D-mannosaminuronic acid dehydrogenase